MRQTLILIGFLFSFGLQFLSPSTANGQLSCAKVFDRGIAKPVARKSVVQALQAFAEQHNLQSKWVEFGPPDRKIKRLLVAVDYTNQPLMEAYRKTFNLDTALDENSAGTLVIEQTRETRNSPEHYVYTYIRSSSDPEDSVYRWGRKDSSWRTSFDSILQNSRDHESGIDGQAFLVDLTLSERENVKVFLDNPELRGPCKSDNCVAWLTGTELGKTSQDATDADRRYLFNELGVSRTTAPFEIARRLMHASNDKLSGVVMFVRGAKGIENFKNSITELLPPEPKIPYASILKGYFPKSPATDAVQVIKDGAKIFFPIAAGASPDVMEALIAAAPNLKKGVDIHLLVNGLSGNSLRKAVEETDGKIRLHALFLGGNMRDLYKEGKVDVLPGNLSDFTRMIRDSKNRDFKYDAIVVRVSPANAQGFHSLGPNHDMVMTILQTLPNIKIIAEVNENIPFTNGDNQIHSSRIAAKFEGKSELAGPVVVPPNPIDAAIGMNLGKLVKSGATLQIGIGNIFGGFAEGLKVAGKTNIKVSTEMMGDVIMEMMKNGNVTDAETGFGFGSGNFYKWLDNNKQVTFRSTEYINSPGRVASIENFHAVNTALQVDLFGQVNATMGPDGRLSSPGGQIEFMSGAARSKGGKAIIAIRSTAKNETISSITLKLYDGPITTPHESVTHVVTEYGIAELRGKSESQRALALIRIAHPKFRQELFDQALAARILKPTDAKAIGLK